MVACKGVLLAITKFVALLYDEVFEYHEFLVLLSLTSILVNTKIIIEQACYNPILKACMLAWQF